MEEKNKLSDDVRTTPEQGSGSLLSAERKLQSKTVEEVATQLNLSVSQIRAIELDQNEGLPEPTYVRGYIRAYAKLLGLDPDEVLTHYLNPNWQKGSRLDDLPKGMHNAGTSPSGNGFPVAKLVLTVGLIGFAVFMWLSGRLDPLLGNSTTNVVEVSESDVASPSAALTPLAQADLSVTEPDSGSTATNDAGVEDSELQADSLADEEDDATEPTGHELILTFSDTSWIDIRDADGKRLAYKSYAGGEELAVSSQIPVSVFIGNAKAVTARYNGADFDLSAHREGVFARFSLGE